MRASEITKLLAVLRGAYPRDKVGDETLPVYIRYLSDLDATDVDRAVDEIIATRKFFPTVSEIRAAVVRGKLGAPNVALALVDLGKVLGHQRAGHRVRPADYMHPLACEALKLMGGTHAYRASTAPGVWRSQFRKVYEEIVADEVFERVTSQLPAMRRARQLEGGEPARISEVAS